MSRTSSTGEELPRHGAPAPEEDALPGRSLWVGGFVAAIIAVAAVMVSSAILRAEASPNAPPLARAPEQIGIVEQTLIRDTQRGTVARAAQRESLERFGWSDRAHGIAKIPIDSAIRLVADPAFMRRAFPPHAADAGSEEGR